MHRGIADLDGDEELALGTTLTMDPVAIVVDSAFLGPLGISALLPVLGGVLFP